VTSRPVVLLHGIESGPSTFWRVGADLSTLGFDVATPTVPGNAGTPATTEGTLAGLARSVPIQEPSVVVGHSLGALVALELAVQRPGLVRALVLEDPPARSVVDPAALAEEIVEDVRIARQDPAGLTDRLLAENPLWARQDAVHAVANRAGVDVERVADPLIAADWDLVAMVAAVSCPVTLIAATPAGSALGGPERAGLLAAADRAVVVESGHGVHRDRPGVWVAIVAGVAATAFPAEGD
jgi:lipase